MSLFNKINDTYWKNYLGEDIYQHLIDITRAQVVQTKNIHSVPCEITFWKGCLVANKGGVLEEVRQIDLFRVVDWLMAENCSAKYYMNEDSNIEKIVIPLPLTKGDVVDYNVQL